MMDSARLNASSALSGIFPYHVSGTLSDPIYTPPHDSIADGASSQQPVSAQTLSGDSVSISDRARQIYDASSSDMPSMASSVMTGMASENILLYNQIRRERDGLEPGDPRIIELSNTLRTILRADKALTAEEMDFIHDDARSSAHSAESAETYRPYHEGTDRTGSASKSQLRKVSDDSAALSAHLSYSTPEASTGASIRVMNAASASSSRVVAYGSPASSSAMGASMVAMHRVA